MDAKTEQKPIRRPPEVKAEWIGQIAGGKTFVDVGGLWGTVNEMATPAIRAGASEVTMIDVQVPSNGLWAAFRTRCDDLGVGGQVREVSGSILGHDPVGDFGRFDVVHCSGILYHVPDPFLLIRNLRAIARQHVIVGSMLIPEVIENSKGRIESPPGRMHCIPLLNADDRAVFAQHYADLNINIPSLHGPFPRFVGDDLNARTGPWWYLFTVESMKRMCALYGLKVINEIVWVQGAANLLCEVVAPPDPTRPSSGAS
jgi:hypothetical protein